MYALVIFFTDGHAQLGPSQKALPESAAARFFSIAAQLPLELQMVLCSRMFGSPRVIVPKKYSEQGFRWLARWRTWQ